jgi:hypothetical protein
MNRASAKACYHSRDMLLDAPIISVVLAWNSAKKVDFRHPSDRFQWSVHYRFWKLKRTR